MSSTKSSSVPVPDSWCSTQRNITKFRYVWTIDNFCICYGDGKTTISESKIQQSSLFPYGDQYEQKWCLKLIPTLRYISLYLHLVSCKKKKKKGVTAKFSFSILNSKKEMVNQWMSKECVTFTCGTSEGISNFIRRSFLLDGENDLITDDGTLSLLCEIWLMGDIINTSGQSYDAQFMIPECRLSEDLQKEYESRKFSDVVFSINGQEFHAHKVVLAARSPVFADMFQYPGNDNQMEEQKQDHFEITDIKPDVFEEMLKFVYTGKSTNLESMSRDLFVAADKYALDRLKKMCENALHSSLSIESVSEILCLADMHSASQLKAQAFDFMRLFPTEVMNTSGWKSVIARFGLFVADILQNFVSPRSLRQIKRFRST